MVDGKSVKLNIWDTAGQERYKSTVPIYLRDAHCIILVFDLTSSETWESIKEWHDSQIGSFEVKPLIVLCGNKNDLKIEVSEDDVKEWANDHNVSYYFTSAATGKGIKELFMYIARTLMVKFPQDIGDTQSTLAAKQKSECAC
ncbi:GTP-binding protein ypt5 [Tritrichomonas foetus]|uniref:GTP-binding protein ypt5 n=1 Tax=Tritrichomonas foetus TaxID=1144522 RepID=A0A1J4K1H8_9EUKA|nr:GTP-binding protein ypt5 [Tritrichomonas foetus]|eukprot:OHT05289.1 GTP-binding protein ypt5 [Tritrichomonas foetus]